MPTGGITSAVAPCDIQCVIGSDRERRERARILAEARPWCRAYEVVGYRGNGDVWSREGRAAIVRDSHALNSLLIHGVEPDHVDRAVGTDLYCCTLAPANRVIVMGGAEGHWTAPGRPSICRACEVDLVVTEAFDALLGELRPGPVNVIVERALGVGIGCDG